MGQEIKVGRREATLVMSKRLEVTLPEIGGVISTGFGEVYGHLGSREVAPNGPPFVIYHGMPHADDPFELEICAPIRRSTDAPDGWRVQELPAGSFATAMHVGPYDTIGTTYEALGTWIGEHGLVAAGPPREVYLSPPETPPTQIRTIVEFPVVEAMAPAGVG